MVALDEYSLMGAPNSFLNAVEDLSCLYHTQEESATICWHDHEYRVLTVKQRKELRKKGQRWKPVAGKQLAQTLEKAFQLLARTDWLDPHEKLAVTDEIHVGMKVWGEQFGPEVNAFMITYCKRMSEDSSNYRVLPSVATDPFQIPVSGRFSSEKERRRHRGAFRVYRFLQANRQLFPQSRQRSEEARVYRSRSWGLPYDLLVSFVGEAYLRKGLIANGKFKQAILLEKLSSGKQLVHICPRSQKQSAAGYLFKEFTIYNRLRDCVGIAQLSTSKLTQQKRGAIVSNGFLMKRYQMNGEEFIPLFATLSVDLQLQVVYQLCAGLEAMHSRGWYHQDIKLTNVLINWYPQKGRIRVGLCDFGCADMEPSVDSISTHGGTVHYMPPERLSYFDRLRQFDQQDRPLGAKTPDQFCQKLLEAKDIWALGMSLYQLYYGCIPSWRPVAGTAVNYLTRLALLTRNIQLLANNPEPDERDWIPRLIWEFLNPDPSGRTSAYEGRLRMRAALNCCLEKP